MIHLHILIWRMKFEHARYEYYNQTTVKDRKPVKSLLFRASAHDLSGRYGTWVQGLEEGEAWWSWESEKKGGMRCPLCEIVNRVLVTNVM